MRELPFTPTRLRSHHRLEKPVSWLELFFDLVFVAAVAQVGSPLAHDYSFAGLARYAFLFFLIWWGWLGHSMFNTRFLIDDPLQRVLTLVQIFATAVMAANARDALSSRDAAGFAAAYAVVRLVLVVQYLRARKVPNAQSLATSHAAGYGIAAAIWVAAAFAETPLRFWLWGIALVLDLLTPAISAHYTHKLPPDPAHLPERFGLFTIILLGESVMAVMRGIESQESWTPQAALSALFGLCLAFGYWWWYFDYSGAAEERHVRSRKHAVAFQIWLYAHFPLYLSIAVAGIGVEHVISLKAGEHMHGEGVTLLATASSMLMLFLLLITLTSYARPWRRLLPQLAVPVLALCVGLPVVREISPVFLLGYLFALCVIGIPGSWLRSSLREKVSDFTPAELRAD